MPKDLRPVISRYLEETGDTQAELARKAGVEQPAVSRLAKNRPRRSGVAYRALYDFMQQRGFMDEPQRAAAALTKTWDGTEGHDQALAGLILASQDLRPDPGKAASHGE